jgi:hypothetical protein
MLNATCAVPLFVTTQYCLTVCCEIDFSEAVCYICSLKKKLKHYEEDFEREYGYRPSHADKMGDKGIKKMYTEMNKLRKEVKCKYSEETPLLGDKRGLVSSIAAFSGVMPVSLADFSRSVQHIIKYIPFTANRTRCLIRGSLVTVYQMF